MPPAPNNTTPTKTLLRCIVFLALVFAVLAVLGKIFDHAAKRDLREKARWVIAKRGESYDFAIMGASRSYVGIDIPTLETNLGKKGVNLSLDGTTFPEQYLALKLFLAHNHIKQLILDVNAAGFDNSAFKFPFRAYEYLPDISDPVVFENLRDNFGCRAFAWKYIPFFKNAEFNSKIGVIQCYTLFKSRFDPRAKAAEFDKYGTRLINLNFTEKVALEDTTWNVDALPRKYFFRLLELAKTNNIDVVLIAAPEYHPSLSKQLNWKEIMAIYESAATSNGLPFLRFDGEGLSRDRSNFFNRNHLNKKGAIKFSALLASRLAELPPQKH